MTDKVFMAFGSVMNGLQGQIAKLESTQAIEIVVKKAWELAKEFEADWHQASIKKVSGNGTRPL